MLKRHRTAFFIVFSAITAFVTLVFCTRSSFLFPMNNWDDANSYFTMGKGLMNGMVIYRDLYDQKGPYLYLLYGIAWLFSHTSFAGVFVLELLAGTATLYFLCRIMECYLGLRLSCIFLPPLAALMFISRSFYWGGAAEEFYLPLLAWSLYDLTAFMKKNDPHQAPSFSMIARAGLFCGIIFQIKYTGVGFYAAFVLIIILMMLRRRDLRGLLLRAGCFILMFLLPSVPWILWFLSKGALDDYWRCYFYNNLFFYSDLSEESAPGIFSLQHFYVVGKILYWRIYDDASYFIPLIIGFGGLLLSYRKSMWERLVPMFLFLGMYFFLSIGGTMIIYYTIPLMIFSVYGFVILGEAYLWIKALLLKRRHSDEAERLVSAGAEGGGFNGGSLLIWTILAISLLLAGGITAFASPNRSYRQLSKEDVFQYRFRDIMLADGATPTLLNVWGLDCGLYTLTGIMPTCEYFQTNGIALPEMFEEQRIYLQEERTDYVVSVGGIGEYVYNHYEEVAEGEMNGVVYVLCRRRNP